jgi:AraC family transcriptional regulator, transcriptional activator of pobA
MRGTTVPPGTPAPGGDLPMHRLEVPRPATLPFAAGTFDTIGPLSRASFPHRHTFHEIVHVTAGTGTHVVDLVRADLRPPHLCVIAPGQVHHWENARDLTGHVLLFTEDFLLGPADRLLLRRLSARPALALDDRVHAATTRVIAEMLEERGAEGAGSVLRALLHVLVVRAARAAPRENTRSGTVADEFARLTAQPGGLWSVADYARHIGVTPGHLTEAVKAATGRPASALVREARIREAKRLLTGTALTVRQVATRVGFGDPAYFCRFFRRETGVSPGGFRENHHERLD